MSAAAKGEARPEPQPEPRLTIFVPNLQGGGAEREMLAMARELSERGAPVEMLVVEAKGPLVELLPERMRLTVLCPSTRIGRLPGLSPWKYLKSFPALVRYLREGPCTMIATPELGSALALAAKKYFAGEDLRLIVRVVINLPQMLERTKDWRTRLLLRLLRRLLPAADAIVANSRDSAEEAERWIRGAKAVELIHNPAVDPERVARAMEARVDHPWFEEGQPPVVLCAGRLVPQKDLPTLLRAFAEVVRARPARLVVLGEGPERSALETLAERLGTAHLVDFAGFVIDPMPWMAKARVFALSSVFEGSPNALVEAMACGTAVVSTDCRSGPRETLADGALGGLVPVGDAGALAAALLEALERPAPSERLRARAADFTVASSAGRYLELLAGMGVGVGAPPASGRPA